MKMNKKGFTLIELLAAVVIAGILTAVAVPSVSNTLGKSHNEYCESNIDTMKVAAQDYFNDNQTKIPKEIGDKKEVEMTTLLNEKYIDKLTDYENTPCTSGKVVVLKTTNSNYEYGVSLDCQKCNNKVKDNFVNSKVKPEISYSPNSGKNENNKDITVKINFADNGVPIYSYKYEIYKKTDSGDILVDGITNYKKYKAAEVTAKLDKIGTYYIKTTAINAAGNKATETSGLYTLSYSLSCNNMKIDAKFDEDDDGKWKILKENEWHKGAFRIKFANSGTITSYDVYMTIDGDDEKLIISRATSDKELTFNKSLSHTYKIRVIAYDESGNKCEVGGDGAVHIFKQDNVAPTCESSGGNGTTNNSRWLNSYSKPDYVKLLGTTDDPGNEYTSSGIDRNHNEKEKYENGNPVKYLRKDTNSYYSPGVAVDIAGNTTKCPTSEWVQIDKTIPTCSVSSENTGKWLNLNDYNSGKRVKLWGTCTDKLVTDADGSGKKVMSGCAGNSYEEYGARDIYGFFSPGNIKDIAGNIGVCDKKEVMVDKSGPTCNAAPDMTEWYDTSSYDITATCDDPTYDGASRSSGCTRSELPATVYEEGRRSTSAGTMWDRAGNSTQCRATTTLIDRTPPSCSVSCYNCDHWTNGTVTIGANCSDGESGCVSSGDYETYDGDMDETIEPGPVMDAVGHITVCDSHRVMIDQTPPDCTASDYSPSITCDGDGDGSGCSTWSNYCPPNGTGTVYDNAGNACEDDCMEETDGDTCYNGCVPAAPDGQGHMISYQIKYKCGDKYDYSGTLYAPSDRNYSDIGRGIEYQYLDSSWASRNGCSSILSGDATPYDPSIPWVIRVCDGDTICANLEKSSPPPKKTKKYKITYISDGDQETKTTGWLYTSPTSKSTGKVKASAVKDNMPDSSWLKKHKCTTSVKSKSPKDMQIYDGDTLRVRLRKKTTSLKPNNCQIRGNTKRSTSLWKCNTHHHKVTSYYTHYCTDSNGKLQTKSSRPSIVTFAYVCPRAPYGPNNGWYVVDDRSGVLSGKDSEDVKVLEHP